MFMERGLEWWSGGVVEWWSGGRQENGGQENDGSDG
jgi:hypothetical protein